MNVYSNFIHNCQNLEATMICFSRWMDRLTVVYPANAVLFSTEKKWAIKPWKGIEKLKCLLLSERSKTEKTTNYMITTMMFWKEEAILTKKYLCLLGAQRKEGKGEWMDHKWERTEGGRAQPLKECHSHTRIRQILVRTNQAQDGGRFYFQSAWSLTIHLAIHPQAPWQSRHWPWQVKT